MKAGVSCISVLAGGSTNNWTGMMKRWLLTYNLAPD
jgi:hypothetical protein